MKIELTDVGVRLLDSDDFAYFLVCAQSHTTITR